MSLTTLAIADASLKLRWREPYVTEGVDTAMLAHPNGCYRGFWIEETGPVSTSFMLKVDSTFGTVAGVSVDSFAMFNDETAGFALAVRESASITISLAAVLAWPLAAAHDFWIWIDVNYAPNVATTAHYRVEDGLDPRIANPTAVVLGVLHVNMGAATIVLHGGGANATVSYTNRTIPQATARETRANFVAGDRTVGLMTGEDRYVLPTPDEKEALDAAATAATAANPYVTEADSTDKIWAEPQVVTVVIPPATAFVDLDLATYGEFYVGLGPANTAQQYFDIRQQDSGEAACRYPDGQVSSIWDVCQFGGAVSIVPAADADANGFYSGAGVRIYFSSTLSAVAPVNVDIWYGRKQTLPTLTQTPSLALARVASPRRDHASQVREEIGLLQTPPGCPLSTESYVQDELELDRIKLRGSHSAQLSETDLARKLFYPNKTFAQVYGDASEETLALVVGAPNVWPRCMCYGFNDYGPILAEGLDGGERFLLWTVQEGGYQQIARDIISDNERLSGAIAYIDPIADLNVSAIPNKPAMSAWRISALASDGRYIYIRLLDNTSAAAYRHVLMCYDILNRTSRWVPIYQVVASSTASTYSDNWVNGQHLCIVDSTHFAINRQWEDLVALGPALNFGIEIRVCATGALIAGNNTGFGSSLEAGWSMADAFCAGPICSDGTNAYFVVRSSDGGYANCSYGVGQCKISDPQDFQVGADNPDMDLSAWNPTATSDNPRSLVYDGHMLWLSTKFALTVLPPLPVVGDEDWLVFQNGADFRFIGDVAFDGKHIWVGVADFAAGWSQTAGGLYHIVRLNPACIEGMITGAHLLCELSTYMDKNFMWSLEPIHETPIDWTNVVNGRPFGNMVYDGDTLWWTKSFFQGAGSTARVQTLQRLPNVHGV